jgi:hypothetical protein
LFRFTSGHNLNLASAGQGDSNDGDLSGMMGYGYNEDSTKMCFNPAKSWQLGWYSERRIELDMKTRSLFSGKVIGLKDYDSLNTGGKYVNIKIRDGSVGFFLGYNNARGINSDTREGQNRVTIHSQKGSGYSRSDLLADLAQFEEYRIVDYKDGVDLIVKVNEIDPTAIPSFAQVDIYLDGCGGQNAACGSACGTCCDDSDCDAGDACATGTCSSDGSCSYDTSTCDDIFKMTVVTDDFPDETTWDLVDDCDNGNVVLSGGPYSAASTTYTEVLSINGTRQYTLTINDGYGDGICCEEGDGSFSATMNGLGVGSGGDYGDSDSVTFGSCGWVLLFEEGFENGYGVFDNGGADTRIQKIRVHEGKKSLRLRDNTDTSEVTTTLSYNVVSFNALRVSFFYNVQGIDDDDFFVLSYAVDGGGWIEAGRFVEGVDWQHNVNMFRQGVVEWNINPGSLVKLRFKSFFGSNRDKVYFDKVVFEGRSTDEVMEVTS